MSSPNFDLMHLRVSANINDVQLGSTSQITSATQNGKKRSSSQRSRDLMDGRYYLMSVLRIVDKQIFYGIRKDMAFDTNGYLDVTTYGIINHGDIFLTESTTYNKPVAIKDGNELPIYTRFLSTSKTKEMVAAIVSDNSSTTRLTRLRLYKGTSVTQAFTAFKFDVGFYALPLLTELIAESATDITEPRIWWPVIESYATYLGWLGSGNAERANIQLRETDRLTSIIVHNEYGSEAARQVSQLRQTQQLPAIE